RCCGVGGARRSPARRAGDLPFVFSSSAARRFRLIGGLLYRAPHTSPQICNLFEAAVAMRTRLVTTCDFPLFSLYFRGNTSHAFEAAGVEFIDEKGSAPGLRFRKPQRS